VVLAGLALGAAIAIATSMGGKDDDEERRADEIERLSPSTSDDVAVSASDGDGDGAHAGDVSRLAQTLNESASALDAR